MRHFPFNPPVFPERMQWTLLSENRSPCHGLALIHQQSCWFMSTTANQGTICLRQFTSSALFYLFIFCPSHTACVPRYSTLSPISLLFSQQNGGPDPSKQFWLCNLGTLQSFNMMKGAGEPTLGFVFGLSCQNSADTIRPARSEAQTKFSPLEAQSCCVQEPQR